MRKTYISGKIDRDLKTLVWNLVEKEKIKNADVIVLGNLGAGIKKIAGIENLYYRVRKRLETNDINLWALRGNGDDPNIFSRMQDLPRLKFLKDHKEININNFSVYPIGGEVNEEGKWGIEKIRVPKLPIKVDIILSSQSPISMKPHLERDSDMPYEYWKNILEERTYLNYVLQEVRSSYWYCGNSSEPCREEFGETIYRSLDKFEILEIQKRELL